jgi:diadenosine tetraphosphatase ApaH/serine/threonine PP2A family protein phosphatase
MRCALVSDIHANLLALEAVLADIDNQADRIWCLGDIVGYGPNPNECVARVRERGAVSVVGNHDWACLGKVDLAEFNPDARRACHWTMEQLTDESRSFLDQLPTSLVIGDFTMVHGSPRSPVWEYITQPEIAEQNRDYFDTSICLVGHTHVPLAFRLDAHAATSCERRWLSGEQTLDLSTGRWILNPGGVGQPRDGNPEASYCLIDTTAMVVRIRRVPYNVEETQRQMEKAGLPGNLIMRLAFGW